MWQVEWPQEVKERLVTDANRKGDLTNSDLEMAAEVLGWLVLEAIAPTRHTHVGVCSDNSPHSSMANERRIEALSRKK